MSHADHEWAKEQIAAHLAGGLSADERARLEAHMASCAECIAEVDAARRFDRQMDDLFAPIRPKAGLEERIIRQIRLQPARKPRSTASRYILAAAAVVLMGILGFVIIQVDEGGFRDASPVAADPVVRATKTREAKYSYLSEPAISLESADKLARLHADKESDHFESLDDRASNGRMKGDSGLRREAQQEYSRKMPQDAPGRALAATPPPAPPAAADPATVLALQDGKDSVYKFRDDGPANNKNLDANAFKPGEAFGGAKQLEAKVEMAKAAEERAAGKGGGGGVAGQLRGEALKEARQQGQAGQPGVQAATVPQEPQPERTQRKIIRTGEVEYEVESFDSSLATISKLVEEEAGFVGTVNSDKLPNGKVRGTVVLRCPPERLDTLLLKLRGLGELKSQNIRSQDVGKQYYDLESRLKAARAMETRLLDIIAKGKGEIKDLLLAEKELGEWRTKIEIAEGEKRYYDSQISLSTLTVTLTEKEIRAPFAVTQTERVRMSVEVEDVEKTHKEALAAVTEAKAASRSPTSSSSPPGSTRRRSTSKSPRTPRARCATGSSSSAPLPSWKSTGCRRPRAAPARSPR